MDFVWFLLIAILSGVFAGMGMGGGTFLIPLITLLMNVKMEVAQCINLLVFVPMAIVDIIIYSKKKLIDFKNWWIISVPAVIVLTIGALVAFKLSSNILKIIFGSFIGLIGIVQTIVLIVKFVKQKSKDVKNQS